MSPLGFKARVFCQHLTVEKFCCEHKNTNVRIIHGFEHMASRWVKCGVEDGWNKQVATKMELQTWPAAEFYGKGLSLVFNNSCSNR